eukprot:355949-Chlamydomonas_euryale.AAC.5
MHCQTNNQYTNKPHDGPPLRREVVRNKAIAAYVRTLFTTTTKIRIAYQEHTARRGQAGREYEATGPDVSALWCHQGWHGQSYPLARHQTTSAVEDACV